jgi:hypothetical protein
MSSGPRGTADDPPSATPEDHLSSVDGSTVGPVERDASEPLPPTLAQREYHVVHVAAPIRVLALVMAAGLVGSAVWIGVLGWPLIADLWAGRAPGFISLAEYLLPFLPLPLLLSYRLLRVARGLDTPLRERDMAEFESRAFLEAVERHDRLRMEAQRLTAEEAGGVVDQGGGKPRLDEPTDCGYEAKIAARMKERGDPG